MENSDLDYDHKNMEAFDLLEDSWFFNNMFNDRTKMLRCYSDPSTSSNFSQHFLPKDSSKKFQRKGSQNGLVRAPSLPPCMWREEKEKEKEKVQERKNNQQTRKTNCTDNDKEKQTDRKNKLMGESSSSSSLSSSSSSRSNLRRTPSLPSSLGRREVIEEENDNDTRMSNLIRQAMANSPDILPRRQSSKAMTTCCSMHGNKLPNDNTNKNGVQEARRQHSNLKKTLRKSFSHLAVAELRGNKDSGLGIDKVDSSSVAVNMAPTGLQETKIEGLTRLKARRPSFSEAWIAQNRPPLPDCVSKNSAEDMKEQLKFWAKAVATNVRQEC